MSGEDTYGTLSPSIDRITVVDVGVEQVDMNPFGVSRPDTVSPVADPSDILVDPDDTVE